MAYIRDFVVTEVTTASTNPQAEVEYPVHATNDVILLMLQLDGDSNTPALPTDYINIQTGAFAGIGGLGYRLCYKVAASAEEVCPTLSAVSDTWHIGVFAIAGADHLDPINVSGARAGTDAATPFTWASGLSTDETNTLILQFLATDGGTGSVCDTPGYTNIVNGDAGANGFTCAVGFQPTAGAIIDVVWRGFSNDDTLACLVAINDDGNGTRPGYCDPSTSATFLKHISGLVLVESDTNPASLAYGAIGMKEFTQVWRDTAGVFVAETTDLNSAATADVTITNTVGNAWYFGYDYAFSDMVLQRSTAQSGGAIAWEYWNGSTWTALVSQSGVLTGTGWVRFTHTPQTSWVATSVNAVSKFYIRMRITTVFTTAPVLSRGHVGGWLTTFDTVANAVDAGTNPYVNASSLTPGSTSNFSGSELLFGTALNMSSGVMIIHHKSALPRDYSVDVSVNDVDYPVTQIGVAGKSGAIQSYGVYLIVLGDASSNYEAYSIHGKKSVTADSAAYNVAAIGLNNGGTPYGTIGALNKSAVTRMLMLPQGRFGPMLSHVSSLSIWSNLVFAGGDSTNPLNTAELRRIANNSVAISLVFNGVGDFNRVYVPIQFGGGHPIKTLVNGAIFQFPTKYDGKRYFDYNGNDDVLGVTFYGTGSADELNFPNCVWKGSQPFFWSFHASHSASTVMDFTGNTVEGATVTLRSTVTLSSLKFSNCDITLNDADISQAAIKNKRTSATAGLVFTSPAEGNGITQCTFTDNNDGDIGHSIRITAIGTYTFDNHIFSGGGPTEFSFHTQNDVDAPNDEIDYTAHGYLDGDAIYYQDQGGTDTIGLTDGGLYYVNAVTADSLAFYDTKANAITGGATGKAGLTDGASGQTHYIYSAKADVYNNSGGAVIINVINNGDTPTLRNSDGSSTTVNNAVTLEINGVVQNTQCYIVPSAGGSALMNETASELVSANEYKATESYNYTGSTPVSVRAREAGYLPFETTGTVTASGLSVTAVWLVDPNYKLVVSGIAITFNDNDPSADTIVRSSGNFATDGWIATMSQVTVKGSSLNNGTYEIASITTDTITLAAGESLTSVTDLYDATLTFTRRSLT